MNSKCLVVFIAAAAALALTSCSGCKTTFNDALCCDTEEQCMSLGESGTHVCKEGQTCNPDFTCVPIECSTSTDCDGVAGKPICDHQLCVASCTNDDECVDPSRGLCDTTSGVCVACKTDMDCSGDRGVCDPTAKTCRGCIADAECMTGVCNEPIKTCVTDTSMVIFVKPDGTDIGTCTAAAPCKTLSFAVQQVTDTRSYIHIDASELPATATTVTLSGTITIDGTHTKLNAPLDGKPALTLTANSVLTLNGVELPFPTSSSTPPALTVLGQAHLYDVGIAGDVACTSATLAMEHSMVTNPDGFTIHSVAVSDCITTIRHSTFDDVSLGATDGMTIVENSLFVRRSSISDAVGIGGPGRFDFNTVVNTSGIENDGAALGCSTMVTASNNIFAYASQHAVTPTTSSCLPTNSLFDLTAVSKTNGSGSKQADATTFFVDRSHGDYHLATSSPAIGTGSAVANIVDDLEGHPRPNPTGSAPDMGAFESPN